MLGHDTLGPTPKENITTIPKEETSGINILYTTLIDLGYELVLREQPNDPNQLKVTADPDTKKKIESIRADINHGDLKASIEALLEPWDGLIDEVSKAHDDPNRVARVILTPPGDSEGGGFVFSPLSQLFVLAYQKGRFGDPHTDATYGHVPLNEERARAVRERLSYTYNSLESVPPISLDQTKYLVGEVIKDYLKPRPTLQPNPKPSEAPVQE